MIYTYRGIAPHIADTAFLAPTACVIGDVQIGDRASLWFNVLVRGDVNFIRIGAGTNIQDNSVIHVTKDTHPTLVGQNVTVGHRVTLHGCHVHDDCLIGIGAILLDGVEIGAASLVAAGSLVVPGTKIPPRSLVMGAPATIKRTLSEKESADLQSIAARYVNYQDDYRTHVQRIA